MISHEVGIHILLSHLDHLIRQFEREIPRITDNPRIYGNVSYMAFESLAAFYNKKVLERYTMDVQSSNDLHYFVILSVGGMNNLLVEAPGLYFHHFTCAGGSQRERLL